MKCNDIVKWNILPFMFRIINNCATIIIKICSLLGVPKCVTFLQTYNYPLWNLHENSFKLFKNINAFIRRLKYNYMSMY